MRDAVAAAERRAEVRAHALKWQEAGWIDAAARGRIDTLFPDDRVRQRRALRVLLFVFTVIAANGAFGFFGALSPGQAWGPLCLIGAVGCAVLTEIQHGKLRLSQFGTESATAWLALGFAFGAVVWLTDFENVTVLAAAGSALAFLAGWRWGSPLQLGLAAAGFFVLLAQLPFARGCWVAAGVVLLPLLDRAAVSPRLAPSHRRGAVAMFFVAAAALGWALHPFGELPVGRLGSVVAAFAWPAFAAFAIGLLGAGIRTRHRWTLDLGLIAMAVLIASTLARIHARPLWLVLAASGLALAGLAIALRRVLSHGRRGISAEAILGDESAATLEVAAALATSTPAPREGQPEPLQGQGGGFGGGGASTHWLLLVFVVSLACGRASGPAEKPLETVEVAPPPDAGASMADDPQSKAIGQRFSGVLPADFPKNIPLSPDWSLADFGAAGAGRRYATLVIPTDVASARSRLVTLLQASGWQVAGADDSRWRAGDREIRLAFTPAGKTTRARIEY
jgi:hypothetical protein